MRKVVCTGLVILAVAAIAEASWKKPYFAGTKPGSWARYSDSSTGENPYSMISTYTRLPDDGGQVRLELLTEFANAQYPPSTSFYTLSKGFDVDHEIIDFGKALVAAGAESGGNKAEIPESTVEIMRKAMPQYGPVAVYKNAQKVDGKSADHYAYVIRRDEPEVQVESGELWLSDGVPFGLIRQTATTKNAQGKVLYTYERKLIASGDSGSAPPPVVAEAPAAVAPKAVAHTLKEAYDAGLISISAEVDPSVKNGERVHLVIESKSEEGFTLNVPKGVTTLHVDIPLDDFIFEVAAGQTFPLTGDQPAEMVVKQTGKKRAMDGKFKITMYEGTPLFSGSATVGWVK